MFRCRQPMVYSEGTSVCHAGLRGWIDKWSIRQFSAYTANSRASRAKLVDLMGVPEHNVYIVPNGHEVDRFGHADRHAIREKLGIRNEQPVFLFVGRLIPTKRVPDLLAAMEVLRHDLANAVVLIAGDGPQCDTLRNEVRDRGLEQTVRFLGQREDVPDLLGAADLFVFPSEVEGLPNVIIEAALAELPIVACDIPGVRDIVGKSDLLVPCRSPRELAHAIRMAMTHAEETRRQARAIRSQVEQTYVISNVLRRLYEIYEEQLHV
jgi:glycosyltransferase involved in cell wall biosynthesis